MSKKGDKAGGSRDRSPLRNGNESTSATFTAQDLGIMLNSAIQAQMPRMIIEASKVAREELASERDDTQRSFTAKFKKLEQSQAELTIQQKASSLKTDGKRIILFTRR